MPPQNNQPNQGSNPAPSQPGPALPNPVSPNGDGYAQPPESAAPQPTYSGPPPLRTGNVNQAYNSQQSPKEDANRYDFFMETKPKSPISLLAATKKVSKLTLIIAGAVGLGIILIVAAIIINTVRSSQPKDNTDTLVGVINQQQEIIRVNNLAVSNVQSTDLANFIATATTTTVSSQQSTIAYIKKHGVAVDTKKLAAYVASSQTDATLTSAAAASVYDPTFQRLMLNMIVDYEASLQKLSDTATTQSEKAIIDQDLSQAQLLHTMLSGEQAQQ